MNIAEPLKVIQELCRALGIDPIADPVTCVTITVRADDVVRVVVEKIMDRTAAPKVIELVQAWDITPDVVVKEVPADGAGESTGYMRYPRGQR